MKRITYQFRARHRENESIDWIDGVFVASR